MKRVKLKATAGMMLTNGTLFGKTVYLGLGDSPDNWWEITEEEAAHKMEQEEMRYEKDLY